MTRPKKKNLNEDPEFGVDSRYASKDEMESEASILMEACSKSMENLTQDQIVRASMMQLKINMEEYIKQPI